MDDVFDEFVAGLTRRALEMTLRPGTRRRRRGHVRPDGLAQGRGEPPEQVQDAVDKGATLHAGGVLATARRRTSPRPC